jgi:hypothetical protein
VPSPVVHPDLAISPSLAATDEDRTAAAIEVRLTQRERFVDARPARHNTTIRPRSRLPCTLSPAMRMTVTISSTVGGSAG